MTGPTDEVVVESRHSRWARRLSQAKPQRIGLRTRILLIFSLGGLAASAFLGTAAYSFTRSTLVKQREKTSIDQAYRDAQTAISDLASNPASALFIVNKLADLGVEGPLLNYRNSFVGGNARFGSNELPVSLAQRVLNDGTASMMTLSINSEPVLVIGIPLRPDANASYFEFVNMADVESTLRSIRLSLFFAGFITTLFGVAIGTVAARRAVRPLTDAAQAAKAIAGGRLDTRLHTTDDPDLRVLASSFNDMAAALQQRVERDARFASDVSHELRSPLMTLAASAEVMTGRRAEMPDRAQAALDLLVGDVSRFQGLVEDLLEISRFDAGAIRLIQEDLLVSEFVRQAVAVSSQPTTPIHVSERAEGMIILGDRRRLARVIANLIDNARLHGGGEPEVTVSEPPGESEPIGHVWISVEDHGSGVPLEERSLIFERFARGAVAGRRSSSDGAGLGLALVDEHVRMHGGIVWVTDRVDGEPGARFVIELPAEEVG